jgi:hypothetical protein
LNPRGIPDLVPGRQAIVYSPGYLQKDTTVRVETNLYAVTEPDGALVWTGMSDTFNPGQRTKQSTGWSNWL